MPASDAHASNQSFNELSLAQAEALALLAEECGEVIQAIGKVLRHGLHSVDPTIADGPNNRETLERELGDVRAAIQICAEQDCCSYVQMTHAMHAKLQKVGRYLHHCQPGEPS